MNWLPRNSVLGELSLDETFVFFDGPRLFTCRSLTDQIYLVAWAEEGAESDRWLYAPISQSRLNLVRSGGITVRSAFEQPEGFLYAVTVADDDTVDEIVEPLSPGSLQDSWLPGEDYRVNLPTTTGRPALSPSEINRRAKQEHRTRLKIELNHPQVFRSEAPTREVGEILILTQKLLDNVGLALNSESDPSPYGRVPADVADKMASDVLAFEAASFVIELGATTLDDLFGDSLFADSTKIVLDLLNPSLRSEDLTDLLSQIGIRASKSFRRFVVGLADSGADIVVAAASANIDYTEQNLSSERLETLVSILNRLVPDEEVSEIRGRMTLFAYNADRNTFGLHDSDGLTYQGSVDERVSNQYRNPTINERYDVVILATGVLDELIGERRYTFTLVQLVPVETESEPEPELPPHS